MCELAHCGLGGGSSAKGDEQSVPDTNARRANPRPKLTLNPKSDHAKWYLQHEFQEVEITCTQVLGGFGDSH